MAKILVTGGAGFIGSHLVDALVERGDQVIVYDNLANGKVSNLSGVRDRIEFVEADVRDIESLKRTIGQGVEYILHQAALGSVPRSINDPITSSNVNINGTLNVLVAAKETGVKRVLVASSSSVYGNTPELPKHEGMPFNPMSPYAFTKVGQEEYARIFHRIYGLETIALRYFNVYGPRQDPNGPYAAVIPRFITAVLNGVSPTIFGNGQQSRDFTYVKDVVQANLKALFASPEAVGTSYNAGAHGQTTLLELVALINEFLGTSIPPEHGAPRAGDVDHSFASIEKARRNFGYQPAYSFRDGLKETVEYFKAHHLAS